MSAVGTMLFTTTQLSAWLGDFLWPMMRVGMVFAIAPIYGGRLVPARVRVVLTVIVTAVLVPVIPSAPMIDPLSAAGVLTSLQQLLIGLIIGFVLQMVFSALMLGGHLIAMGMGLSFASMADPQNGVSVPVIGQYYVTLATLLFLVLNGHLFLISMLAESFNTMPVAVDGISRQTFWDVAVWGSHMFASGVLIALPAVVALKLTNIAFGVITRTAPQLHIFSIGFPITLMLGFVIMFISLPEMIPQFGDMLTDAFEMIKTVVQIRGGAHG
jgi:flagellar biosynthetic protein FliR